MDCSTAFRKFSFKIQTFAYMHVVHLQLSDDANLWSKVTSAKPTPGLLCCNTLHGSLCNAVYLLLNVFLRFHHC